MKTIIYCTCFFIVVLVIGGYKYVTAVNDHIKKFNCQTTGLTRQVTVLVPLNTGNSVVIMPQLITEYEYQCSNGKQWF